MINKDEIIIIGAGGHSKVLLSTVLAAGKKPAGFLDDDPALTNYQIHGYKVLGKTCLLATLSEQAVICGIGENKLRKFFANTYPNLNWKTIVHPTAYVHESVSLGKGTVIFAGVIIQPDSIIGNHAIINTATSVDHDCHVKDFTHIAPGSRLAGNVTVDEGSLLGIGSCVMPNISIGAWSVIGAGSVVIEDLGDFIHAKGIPAKVYKTTAQAY